MEDENFILILIKNVEKHPCLYLKTDRLYFNKESKAKAWESVAEKCGKRVDQCRHRWKLLRERYVKELRKMEALSLSRQYWDRNWIYFEPLYFLKDNLHAPRRTLENTLTLSEDTVEMLYTVTPPPAIKTEHTFEELDDATEQFEQNSMHATRKTRDSSPAESFNTMTPPVVKTVPKLESVCERLNGTIDEIERNLVATEDELFMKLACSMMKKFPEDIKDQVQAKILEVIHQARKKLRGDDYSNIFS